MTVERERLLGIAQAERVALGRTIQYTDPTTWDKPSRLDGWSLKDVVAHLAGSEAVAAAAFGEVPAAELEEFLKQGHDLTIDAFNDFTVEHWLAADARFRGALSVNARDPEGAAIAS